jgi:hypothetical protein
LLLLSSSCVWQFLRTFSFVFSHCATLLPGITIYMDDHTQGPACALSCPAGTVFRNYFAGADGLGQGGGAAQIDTLRDVGALLGNDLPASEVAPDAAPHRYWRMANGYALPVSRESIPDLCALIEADKSLAERMHAALRVGVHWSTQVGASPTQRVAQVFCSALPVAYSRTPQRKWAPFARTVLAAAMDATLAVGAVLAAQRRARVSVYLTSLGGGVFGNSQQWIADAIADALRRHEHQPLDVKLVHYRSAAPEEYAAVERDFARGGVNAGGNADASASGSPRASPADVADVAAPAAIDADTDAVTSPVGMAAESSGAPQSNM